MAHVVEKLVSNVVNRRSLQQDSLPTNDSQLSLEYLPGQEWPDLYRSFDSVTKSNCIRSLYYCMA